MPQWAEPPEAYGSRFVYVCMYPYVCMSPTHFSHTGKPSTIDHVQYVPLSYKASSYLNPQLVAQE